MITIRQGEDRGIGEHGWLHSRHTFSFASYHDASHMGFRALRVINEDVVEPGRGFGTHPHKDMEIISYVVDGALEHADSMGNGSVIRPGEVQRMTAGTGVTHSEFNHSRSDKVHFLQIWIEPERQGLTPGYEQKDFPAEDRRGRLRLVASHDGRDGSLTVHQDVSLHASLLAPGQSVTFEPGSGRHVWIQVVRGSVTINGQTLAAGDGASSSDGSELTVTGVEEAEILLFDLA